MKLALDSHFIPPNPNIWGKDDGPDKQLRHLVECVDASHDSLERLPPGVALIGFACDQKSSQLGGRTGAAYGPDALRQSLASLPDHRRRPFYDLGNITCEDHDLQTAWRRLSTLVHHCHQHHLKTLIIGGGREATWGHYVGLKHHYPSLCLANFDAQLGLNNVETPHASTSFYRIAQDKQERRQPFHYACIGMQATSNSQVSIDNAKQLASLCLTPSDLHHHDLSWQTHQLNRFIAKQSHHLMSIHLEVFQASIVPGVCAPQPLGLMPWQVMPLMQRLLQDNRILGVDLLGLTPKYDQAGCSARLASHFTAEVLYRLR